MPCCCKPKESHKVEKVATKISEQEKKFIVETTLPLESSTLPLEISITPTIFDDTVAEAQVDNDAESTTSADSTMELETGELETGEETPASTPRSVPSKPNMSPKRDLEGIAPIPVVLSSVEFKSRDIHAEAAAEHDVKQAAEQVAEWAADQAAEEPHSGSELQLQLKQKLEPEPEPERVAAEKAAVEKAAAEKAVAEKAAAEKAARKAAKKAAAQKAAAEKAAAEKAAAEAKAAEEAAKIAARDIIHGMKWDDEENVKLYQQSIETTMQIPDWQVAYRSEKKSEEAEVRYMISNEGGYKADVWSLCVMPQNITDVMVAVLEVDAWTKWHPLCTKHVRTGPYDSSVSRSHYEQAIMWGAYKSDQNTVTHRWVNESKGYFVQTLRTLQEGEVGYVKPTHNREDVSGTVVCISVSPTKTIVVQKLSLTPPIKIPSFIEKFFMNSFLPKIIKAQYDNAVNASNPKYPFMKAIEQDETGIYALFDLIQKEGANRPDELIENYFTHLNIKMDDSPVAKPA